jgi:hypothetical protein
LDPIDKTCLVSGPPEREREKEREREREKEREREQERERSALFTEAN